MYVYFVTCECVPPAVKIGISAHVESRIRGLQTAMPYKLEVLGVLTYETMAHARKAERLIHRHLRKWRMRGEWFAFNSKVQWNIQRWFVAQPKVRVPGVIKPVEPNLDFPAVVRLPNGRFHSGVQAMRDSSQPGASL